MMIKVSLYIALVVFGLGMVFRVLTWFRYNPGIGINDIKPSRRILAAIKGISFTVFSPRILTLIKVLFLDVFFQRRILRESTLRWLMHMCIYGGFMLLLFMHALENIISSALFPDYASTLNPFLFLRTFFGLMIIAGLAISFYRRHILKTPRLMSNAMDHYAVIILAIIMISGFLLEGTKIVSFSNYQVMVEDYADFDDDESLNALESYWVAKYGVVSPNLKGPFDSDILDQGQELHEDSCAACHSRPQWAFISYGVAGIIKPFALGLDRAGVYKLLWYIHFLACFLGLAFLPFSRMFHIIASPLCLLINSVMDEGSDPANIATRQVIELDACTHCGTCSLQCFVGITYEVIHNRNILPSEKMASLKKFISGKKLSEKDQKNIQEGLYLCTNCYRCTLVCPVGINLQDLWFNVRESFIQNGHPELFTLSPLSWYRGLRRENLQEDRYQRPLQQAKKVIEEEFRLFDEPDTAIDLRQADRLFKKGLGISDQSNTFAYCFTCTTCTSSCPVVLNYENPAEALGMVPHQIIHAAAVGFPDMIYRSKMLWSCLGCYQCQDACPQGVCVTDVLCELKNIAVRRIKEGTQSISTGELL